VTSILNYSADSLSYYFVQERECPSTPRPSPIELPIAHTPPPAEPILRSPLQLLADASYHALTAPAQFPTSPSSGVTPYSCDFDDDDDTDTPQTPVSPIDYERVAEHTPTPEPTFFPSTAPSPRPLPLLPNDAWLDNQENRPPLPDFSAPPCVDQENDHPHQFLSVTTPRKDEWRPESELTLDHVLLLPLAEDLISNPPRFPTVTPFRNHALHVSRVKPSRQPLTAACFIPPLTVCSKAIRTPGCNDFPLGYIKYSFACSLVETFSKYPDVVRSAFKDSLVVLEVVDLLDGRSIVTYGYLKFEGTNIFVTDQCYHCEDAVRNYPHLLAYTFTPRIPADPFSYLRVHPDTTPLSTA
jgi:hypothetical protein